MKKKGIAVAASNCSRKPLLLQSIVDAMNDAQESVQHSLPG